MGLQTKKTYEHTLGGRAEGAAERARVAFRKVGGGGLILGMGAGVTALLLAGTLVFSPATIQRASDSLQDGIRGLIRPTEVAAAPEIDERAPTATVETDSVAALSEAISSGDQVLSAAVTAEPLTKGAQGTTTGGDDGVELDEDGAVAGEGPRGTDEDPDDGVWTEDPDGDDDETDEGETDDSDESDDSDDSDDETDDDDSEDGENSSTRGKSGKEKKGDSDDSDSDDDSDDETDEEDLAVDDTRKPKASYDGDSDDDSEDEKDKKGKDDKGKDDNLLSSTTLS